MVIGQFQPARPGGMVTQKAVGYTRSPYRQRGGIIGDHILMSGYTPRQMRYITRRMTKRRKGKKGPKQTGGFLINPFKTVGQIIRSSRRNYQKGGFNNFRRIVDV